MDQTAEGCLTIWIQLMANKGKLAHRAENVTVWPCSWHLISFEISSCKKNHLVTWLCCLIFQILFSAVRGFWGNFKKPIKTNWQWSITMHSTRASSCLGDSNSSLLIFLYESYKQAGITSSLCSPVSHCPSWLASAVCGWWLWPWWWLSPWLWWTYQPAGWWRWCR